MDSVDVPLFRPEAVPNHYVSHFGDAIALRIPSGWLYFCISIAFLAAIISVSYLCTYTSKTSVEGVLTPESGLLSISPGESGIVTQRFVNEGDTVKKGSPLFEISIERQLDGLELQASVSGNTLVKHQLLTDSLTKLERQHKMERESVLNRLTSIRGEIQKEKDVLVEARARLELSEKRRDLFSQIQKQGYVSQEQVLDRSEDLIEQKIRTHTLERELLSLEGQAAELESTLKTMPVQHDIRVSALKQQMADAASEWSRSEHQRSWTVTAPVDGMVSTVNGDVGANVQANSTLLAITPRASDLQAHLYAPSSAIGFVEKGQKVHLRYRAYPYQKFGQPIGTVISVSRTAAPASTFHFQSSQPGQESLYRIIVALPSQSIIAYGNRRPLQPGMRVDAEILQETRPLYEWALEPLLTITGTL